SRRNRSTRPFGSVAGLLRSTLTRTVFIMSNFSAICLASRNDANGLPADCAGDAEDAPFDRGEHPIPFLAVVPSVVHGDEQVRIRKRMSRIGEVESSARQARLALGEIPFELGDQV